MSELLTTEAPVADAVPTQDEFEALVTEYAKTPEDIIAAREMAASDLAKVSIASESGRSIDVVAIGSEKFSELTQPDPESVKAAMAVNSDSWQREDK